MSGLRIGSLFSGVGGLDLAVEAFFGAETVWHCEYDENPSKVLAARWPGVPNLGDITAVDWSTVEPVDIVCGGSPCQDVSAAGPRAGMTEGTRSNLWVQMREAIAYLKPSVVIWENVRGALSAYAFSSVESDPGLLGEHGPDRPALRAAGRVVGDLSTLGYDAIWTTLPASDVGAPHKRERVFVLAYARGLRLGSGWDAAPGEAPSGWTSTISSGRGGASVDLLPTPQVADATGGHASRSGERSDELLLPGVAARVHADTVALLPTPRASRGASSTEIMYALGAEWSDEGDAQGNVTGDVAWNEFEPAVRRWEAMTRPVPAPTRPDGKNGRHRFSPQLPEWMMGYPLGWVTDILGREAAIKACGNGVVPPQAHHAIATMWPRVVAHLQGVAA